MKRVDCAADGQAVHDPVGTGGQGSPVRLEDRAKYEDQEVGGWIIVMRWTIPLGTGGVMFLPLVVVSVISIVSPYCILDNPDFWYGYMGYVGTVVLAGAALWQNQSFRIESRRKEEYAIRPYLFSQIEAVHIDFLAEHDVAYIQIELSENGEISRICERRNSPQDVMDYVAARQERSDSMEHPVKCIRNTEKASITKELHCLQRLMRKYELISYCLENHGTGSAVKIWMELNNHPLVPLFCLSHGEKRQLYILVNADKLQTDDVVEFNVSVEFYNIEDFGPYVQRETFSISRFDAGDLGLIIDEQISSPVLVKKGSTKEG